MNRYRAYFNTLCVLKPNPQKGTGSFWEKRWQMGEVQSMHFKKGTVRVSGIKTIYNSGFPNNSKESYDVTIGPDCFLMKYTDMMSDNNVLVCQGDIVEYTLTHDSSNKKIVGIIEWHNHAWRLNRIWLLTEVKNIWILGNIHQSPEFFR